MTGTPPIPVIAAVVERDGRYLLGRRPVEKRHGGMWEFPGGKLDDGESIEAGARRELSEELELDVRGIGETLFRARDPGAPFEIVFVRVDAAGAPVRHEHDEVGWFTPRELTEMPLAPADAAFVEHVLLDASESA